MASTSHHFASTLDSHSPWGRLSMLIDGEHDYRPILRYLKPKPVRRRRRRPPYSMLSCLSSVAMITKRTKTTTKKKVKILYRCRLNCPRGLTLSIGRWYRPYPGLDPRPCPRPFAPHRWEIDSNFECRLSMAAVAVSMAMVLVNPRQPMIVHPSMLYDDDGQDWICPLATTTTMSMTCFA